MKSISIFFIHLVLVGLASGCFKGVMDSRGEVPSGFLGTGITENITLDDDVSNQLLWRSTSNKTVIGNVLNPVINGSCTGVRTVELWDNGTLRKSVPCVNKKFQISLNGRSAFTNGIYSLEFKSIPSSVIIERTYDVLSLDPTTLVVLGNIPASSIDSSIDVSITCQSDLTLSIAGILVYCDNGEIIVQPVALVLGTNSFIITWTDIHHNTGTHSVSIVRNSPGTPEITAGMVSATSDSVIDLTNCSGVCDGTTLFKVAINGYQVGSTNQAVPLSYASINGGSGETISTGNHTYIFCERQNGSGECIP